MSKILLEVVGPDGKLEGVRDSSLSRRELLGAAGQVAVVGVLTACGSQEPRLPSSDLGIDMQSLSPDMATSDLGNACMHKIATGAEMLAVNEAMSFLDPEHSTKSFLVGRDANGFFALRNECAHAGCQTNFNAAEKTFDCPCHGSRYNFDGTLLRGPAAGSLKSFPLVKRDDGRLEVDTCGPGSTDLSGRVT